MTDASGTATCAPRPASIRAGLALVRVGVVVGCLDLIADSVLAARLLALADETPDEQSSTQIFYAVLGVRVVVYLVAVSGTLLLLNHTCRGSDRARVGLMALMCVYAAGCVVNFGITQFEIGLVGLVGSRMPTWAVVTAVGTVAVDVVLLILAAVVAVLLFVGRSWAGLSQPVGSISRGERKQHEPDSASGYHRGRFGDHLRL